MKVAMLGSGSGGNATVVLGEKTRILVDAGFSGRQIAERLDRIGVEPASVDAVVVTHEHRDHTRGIGVFSRRFGTPLYLTPGTREACASLLRGEEPTRDYSPGSPFRVGDLRIDPFLTAHDAVDPVAVTVTSTACGTRLGIATDLGRPTAGIRHALERCDFLVLESNYDESLLRSGPYPASVQARIASSHGHLSNHAAAGLACELLHPRLVGIFLAHLSRKCNCPVLARRVVRDALKGAGWNGFLEVVEQDEPTALVDVRRLHARREHGQLSLFT